MPNLTMFRPADANETLAAWKFALKATDRPTILALSRQVLPVLESTGAQYLSSEGVIEKSFD